MSSSVFSCVSDHLSYLVSSTGVSRFPRFGRFTVDVIVGENSWLLPTDVRTKLIEYVCSATTYKEDEGIEVDVQLEF